MELQHILIRHIQPDPNQPRRNFDEKKLAKLAKSIRENGLIEPVGVEKVNAAQYQLVYGERRWRAAQMAGLRRIPAIVRPAAGDDLTRFLQQVLENSHREDLDVIERAYAYKKMLEMPFVDERGRTRTMAHTELGAKLGISYATISSYLQWLELEPEIQELVAQRNLPHDKRVARALMALPEGEIRIKTARLLARNGKPSIKMVLDACEKARQKVAEAMEPTGNGTQTAPIKLYDRTPSANGIQGPPSLHLAQQDNTPPDAHRKYTWEHTRRLAGKVCDQCAWQKTAGVAEPAWMLVQEVSASTCRECPAQGDILVCQECPLVTMLRSLIQEARHA